MEKEFLHRINVKALLKEVGMTMEEMAELAGYSRASNLNKWGDSKEKGGARPSFNTFVKLIEAGATVETLFGVEYAGTRKAGETPSQPLTDQQIFEAYHRALSALEKNQK